MDITSIVLVIGIIILAVILVEFVKKLLEYCIEYYYGSYVVSRLRRTI